ncbi:MAG: ParB/RepB/Spo0J family partition protein [Muribaculaceae bacterium]|nr:ParB/RepB/Spo0J family partition protein [Muribaculaceae bacterium]MDE6787628.1 ParB/RepB/Spo0J family partition protein [Muribaculaceae bacterium]
MAIRRNALGRGLDSLIGISEVRTDGSSAISEINIDLISPNPDQPRRSFSDEGLDELAASIRELGIIQPLSLRDAQDGKYQIIAGERRWRAALRAGLLTVPAYVRTASDSEVTEMALIENIQREDLNAIEVALAFKKLLDTYSMTQERLSERVGKSRTVITNHLRLLKLPAEIQIALRDRKLDMGHARALLSIDDAKLQLKIFKQILKEGLSVRMVEQLARQAADADAIDVPSKKNNSSQNHDYDFFVRDLQQYFPTPVKFSRSANGKGSITLKFDNDEQLMQLVGAFENIKK